MLRFLLALVLLAGLPVLAPAKGGAPVIVLPTATNWTAVTSGPMAGAQMAVLLGNPAKRGPYIVRVKVKDGTKFDVHYHSELENVTVISGTLLVGLGEKMNTSKMIAIPTGGFVSVPANLHHYAMAKGETVIQIDSMGPRTMTAVKSKK